MTESIISSAVGTMPAAIIAETASDALSMSEKAASQTRTASGVRSSLTQAEVTMPSVPSLPTSAAVRSYPASSTSVVKTSPRSSTISNASTWLTVVPYERQCGPPAFVAMLPPIVELRCDAGSGA